MWIRKRNDDVYTDHKSSWVLQQFYGVSFVIVMISVDCDLKPHRLHAIIQPMEGAILRHQIKRKKKLNLFELARYYKKVMRIQFQFKLSVGISLFGIVM